MVLFELATSAGLPKVIPLPPIIPITTANVLYPPPKTLQFLIVLLVAPSVAVDPIQIVAELLALVLVIVMSFVVPPELEPFIGLVGAVFFSTLGLIVPSIVETVFRYPHNLGPFKWILWKNIILGVFSLIALFTGAYVSILDIIELYTPGGKEE